MAPKKKPEGDGPFLTITTREMWDEFKERWDKVDTRLKRLEIVVALIAVYALGQGGASFLGRLGVL
jgi:hypothetical protein